MVGDVEALQSLYVRGFGPPVVALVIGAASVTAVAIFSPVAAVVLGAGLFAGGVLVPAVASAPRAQPAADSCPPVASWPRSSSSCSEARLSWSPTAGRCRAARARTDAKLARLGRRTRSRKVLSEALSVLVTGLTVAGVLAVAVAEHDAGALDRVLVATLALLALSAFDAVLPLSTAARELDTTLAAGRRVLELTDAEAVIRDLVSPVPHPPRHAPIELHHVTARYDTREQPVLEGVDLRLEPGARVALVGPSGSGKTTVTNLLLRFLDPESGRVTIAGRDIREYRQEDVRATFALAGQNAHVFHSTIRANLLVGDPAATDNALWDALRRARIDAWVANLPDGLETMVGEERQLSGGQRQRLVLARAPRGHAGAAPGRADRAPRRADRDRGRRDVLTAAEGKTVLLITHRPGGARPRRRDRPVGMTIRGPPGHAVPSMSDAVAAGQTPAAGAARGRRAGD